MPLDGGEGDASDRFTEYGQQGLVFGYQEIRGNAQPQGLADDPLDFLDGVVCRQLGADTTGGSREGRKLPIKPIAQGVMRNQPGPLNPETRRAHQMEHRETMGAGAHDAVQRTQLAHAIGGGQQGRTSNPRIAIGGIGRIQFIGGQYPLQP